VTIAASTMTNNGYTPSFFDYSRTFLPKLPKNVKNRNMERSRQGLRTSSEEYGQFWNSDSQSRALPPIYLTDPTPETIATASKWYRSPSSRRRSLPQNVTDDVGSNFRHVIDFRRNGSHRNGYDLLGSAYSGNESDGGYLTDRPRQSDVGVDGDRALRPWSTYRGGPRLWSDTAESDRVRRHRYNLTIYDNDWQAPLTSSLSDWKLADISQVDLQVRLHDNSVIGVPDVPFNIL